MLNTDNNLKDNNRLCEDRLKVILEIYDDNRNKTMSVLRKTATLKIKGTAVDTKYISKAIIEWKIICECGCEVKVSNINDLSRVIGKWNYRKKDT